MIYLRSTLFALFLLVFTPIWAVICLAVFPFMRSETRYRKTDSALPLTGVPIVGDSLRDLEAATVLGAIPHLVRTGKGQKTVEAGILPAGTVVHADLMAFTKSLLGSASNT